MDQAKIARVADLLVRARAARREIADLPADGLPADAAEAYAIQDAVAARVGPVGGWKVGAGSPSEEPSCAPLFAALIFPAGAPLPADRFGRLGLEAEIAFRLGRDLPPRATAYGREDVLAAVASLHAAIEVVDTRLKAWPDVERLWHLADNGANGGFVYGPGVADWRGLDFTKQPAVLSIDGTAEVSTVGGNKAVDLVRLLVWLANHCADRRGGLKAGDFVTTGSCTGLIFTHAGAAVRAEFPGIGAAELSFPA